MQQLKQKTIEAWVWSTLMELAAQPERIEAELVQRREDAEKDQHLALQALAGLQRKLVRLQRQKAEFVKLYLNRDRAGSVLTREEYETKASQMAAEIKRLETQSSEMQQHNSAEAMEILFSRPNPHLQPAEGPVAVEDPAFFSGKRGRTIGHCSNSMDSALRFSKPTLGAVSSWE